MKKFSFTRFNVKLLYILAPLIVGCITLGFGRYEVGLTETISTIVAHIQGNFSHINPATNAVIWDMRMPRALLAILVGSGLACAGASFQALFTNPLATPDTLGVGAGATFGAVLGIMLNFNLMGVQILALIWGLIAVGIAFHVGVFQGRRSIISVILAGIVIVALFQALVSLMKYMADPLDTLPSITYWIMGSLGRANYSSLAMGVPFIIVGMLFLYSMRWRLNILSLDEDEAKALGVNVTHARFAIIGAATLVTASCVSMCGQVGWVGLVVPHLARMLVGADNQKMIPLSMSLGAVFVLIIDTVARTISPAEIPISVLTALIGAPVFIYLLKKTGGNW